MEKVVIESVAMNGGVGDYSYANNSSLQRSGFEAAKSLIHEAIMEKLDIKHLCNGNSIRITDLGCSVGPNTFIAVENIVEAIEQRHHSEGLKLPLPEFHVYFNDQLSNDFNTLFNSLPLERRYFAAGVPGSFHTRLFPEKSIDLVYSLGALQWLSKVPEDVVNIGRIHYSNAPSEVMEAYKGQFSKDMERFLDARAKEVVHGGLMVLSFPCLRDGQPYSRFLVGVFFSLLGSALMDMVKMGKVDQTKVDAFDVPFYAASPKEVEALVERNGHFTIERMETQDFPILQGKGAIQVYSKHNRACTEGLIRQYFGHDDEIIDELFDLFTNKLSESFSILEESCMNFVFVLLKRKQD
ncbi:hypothetical protein Scep_022652 [Stephania cephalantha]|uniref:S-adenosylmethionine-dependent methyltransferase At5g38100 n=1 Tax=Stephania cephalantha TaxID=152367 RepID=A0AAP0HY03_9MAGN